MRRMFRDRLFLYPFVLATIVLVLWLGMRSLRLQASKDDTQFLLSFIEYLSTFHAIGATGVLLKAWKDGVRVGRLLDSCPEDENEITDTMVKEFQGYAEDRIPGVIHVVIASLSVLMILLSLFVSTDAAHIGALGVFALTLVLGIYWAAAITLDSPHDGEWFGRRIPPRLLAGRIEIVPA